MKTNQSTDIFQVDRRILVGCDDLNGNNKDRGKITKPFSIKIGVAMKHLSKSGSVHKNIE